MEGDSVLEETLKQPMSPSPGRLNVACSRKSPGPANYTSPLPCLSVSSNERQLLLIPCSTPVISVTALNPSVQLKAVLKYTKRVASDIDSVAHHSLDPEPFCRPQKESPSHYACNDLHLPPVRLQLATLLPLPPNCWGYMRVLPCLASLIK